MKKMRKEKGLRSIDINKKTNSNNSFQNVFFKWQKYFQKVLLSKIYIYFENCSYWKCRNTHKILQVVELYSFGLDPINFNAQ